MSGILHGPQESYIFQVQFLMSAHFELLLLMPLYGLDLEHFWNGESEFKSEVQLSSRKSLKKTRFHWKSNVHEWVCGGKLLSVTLRHNDRGKTLPYMGIHQTLCLLISLNSGLALYDAHIWRSYAVPWAMRSLLKEQTFFGRMSFSRRAKNAIGLEPTMGGQLLSGLGTPVDTF